MKTLKKLFRKTSCREASLYTSCASYYILLSVLPALMFFLALFSVLPISQSSFWYLIQSILPEPLVQPLIGFIREAAPDVSASLSSVSAVVWVWSASKGFFAVADGMDAVLNIPHERSYLRKRISAAVRFFILSLSLMLAVVFCLFGERLLACSIDLLPGVSGLLLPIVQHRMIVSFALMSVMFSMIYRLHPDTKLQLRYCLLSGTVTTAGWFMFTFLFSVYITHFSGQFRLFGNLGAVLLLAVWLRYCILILLFGIKYAWIRSSGHHSLLHYFRSLLADIHE